MAFAGTVAAVAIKRHKVPDEIKSALNNFKATNEAANSLAESVQRQADEVTEYAQKLFDEVTELFKKGGEIAPDGIVLRRITGNGPRKVMEEFADDTKKFAKEIYFLEDGKPSLYQEGFEKLADRSEKVAKQFKLTKKGWQKISN